MHLFNPVRMLRGMEPAGEIPGNRELLQETLRVAWPSILESFLISLIGLIDTMMVSTLGPEAIAAIGLTTQPKFIGLAFFLSLNTAISALVARRHGEDDRQAANKILIQALVITVGLTLIISTLCVTLADPIILMAGSEPETHEMASSYFKLIMGCMGFNTVSMVINAAQRGAGNTKISMRTNIVSNLVNVLFNYLLIGGNLGFPKLGVQGAAIATILGTCVAMGMSIASVFQPRNFVCLIGHLKIKFDKVTLSAIANIGSSTLVEQIFLRIGFLIYAIIVAKLGTTVFAAHQIGMNILSISFSFGDGLSIAAIALVGHSLGAKRKDLARIYGGVCQRIGLCFSALLAVIYLTLGQNIFRLFGDDPVVMSYSNMLMSMIVIIVLFQITQVVYSGCLRGAGDTRYTALVSLVSVAIIRPGSGFLFTYPLGLGLTGAWIGLAFDQVCRFLMTWVRFRKGKWTDLKI